MMRVLLIDDEQSTINVLEMLIKNDVPAITEIHTALGATEGLLKINELKPDLLFLDIEMPGMNGFQLLEHFPSYPFQVIFVTAYDHYAIKALRYSALDYLLKPVDVSELQQAVNRFLVQQTQLNSQTPLYNNLIYNIQQKELESYKLAIPGNDGVNFYNTDDIIRCEAESNYTRFYFNNQRPAISSRTLKDYEDLLSERNFLRIHRTHLVNKKYVSSLTKNHEMILTDGSIVQVSRRKWDFVKQKIGFNSNY